MYPRRNEVRFVEGSRGTKRGIQFVAGSDASFTRKRVLSRVQLVISEFLSELQASVGESLVNIGLRYKIMSAFLCRG